MLSITAARGMLRTDGRRIIRDRFLIGMVFYVVGISAAIRWILPWVTAEVAVRFAFDLTPYHPLAVSHIVVQLAGLLPGIIGGFLLLEGREDGTVKALLVSPVPLPVYLVVLCVMMACFSLVLTITEGAIIGLALPSWPALLGAAVAGAPAGAGLALFIATFADNKTEAFAWMKVVGLAPIAASGAYFLPEPWQWLAALYPPYSASKAFWVAEAGSAAWPLWVMLALGASAIWLLVLGRAFLKAARQ